MVEKKVKKVVEEITAEDLVPEEPSEEKGFDFMALLKDPMAQSIMSQGKDLFKKEKPDPDMCEIIIKAPSKVVLKLFHVYDEKEK